MEKLKLLSLEAGVERDEDFYGAQVGVGNYAEEARGARRPGL